MTVGCGAASPGGSVSTQTESSRSGGAPTTSAGATHRAVPREVRYRPLYSLAAPLRDPAAVKLSGGRFALLGGLDAADVSVAGITVADMHKVIRTAALPLAQHDAQGAELDGLVYVFGGGADVELSHIISFDPVHGTVRQVGALPHAQSDVAVTATRDTAYIIGGYDGTRWLNTILAWRPGTPPKVIGHLPVGLRYAAATTAAGTVIICGGSTPTGASRAIYSFNPATGSVKTLGRLPSALTHAAAATLGGFVYLIGGRGNDLGSQTAAIHAIDPHSGRVRVVGRLPQPLSDLAAVTNGKTVIVAGGLAPSGTVAQVGEVAPSP